MRAFRPSHFVTQDDVDEEVDQAKQANMRQYSQRAQNGLPLFDKISQFTESKRASFGTVNKR